ncbi:MAG TPA: hypothetical protein VJB90_01360 [Candidatus Nanoarchaeia archaeon]|nr:hypothetical protein [Candidatus Nanoarchaeia archaeon]
MPVNYDKAISDNLKAMQQELDVVFNYYVGAKKLIEMIKRVKTRQDYDRARKEVEKFLGSQRNHAGAAQKVHQFIQQTNRYLINYLAELDKQFP